MFILKTRFVGGAKQNASLFQTYCSGVKDIYKFLQANQSRLNRYTLIKPADALINLTKNLPDIPIHSIDHHHSCLHGVYENYPFGIRNHDYGNLKRVDPNAKEHYWLRIVVFCPDKLEFDVNRKDFLDEDKTYLNCWYGVFVRDIYGPAPSLYFDDSRHSAGSFDSQQTVQIFTNYVGAVLRMAQAWEQKTENWFERLSKQAEQHRRHQPYKLRHEWNVHRQIQNSFRKIDHGPRGWHQMTNHAGAYMQHLMSKSKHSKKEDDDEL